MDRWFGKLINFRKTICNNRNALKFRSTYVLNVLNYLRCTFYVCEFSLSQASFLSPLSPSPSSDGKKHFQFHKIMSASQTQHTHTANNGRIINVLSLSMHKSNITAPLLYLCRTNCVRIKWKQNKTFSLSPCTHVHINSNTMDNNVRVHEHIYNIVFDFFIICRCSRLSIECVGMCVMLVRFFARPEPQIEFLYANRSPIPLIPTQIRTF